jgi:hypothetical protein
MGLDAKLGKLPPTQIQALGTLSDTAVSTNGGVYDFLVNPGVPLTANTRYFITLYANHTGSDTTSPY